MARRASRISYSYLDTIGKDRKISGNFNSRPKLASRCTSEVSRLNPAILHYILGWFSTACCKCNLKVLSHET